jgi:hypothetical protein
VFADHECVDVEDRASSALAAHDCIKQNIVVFVGSFITTQHIHSQHKRNNITGYRYRARSTTTMSPSNYHPQGPYYNGPNYHNHYHPLYLPYPPHSYSVYAPYIAHPYYHPSRVRSPSPSTSSLNHSSSTESLIVFPPTPTNTPTTPNSTTPFDTLSELRKVVAKMEEDVKKKEDANAAVKKKDDVEKSRQEEKVEERMKMLEDVRTRYLRGEIERRRMEKAERVRVREKADNAEKIKEEVERAERARERRAARHEEALRNEAARGEAERHEAARDEEFRGRDKERGRGRGRYRYVAQGCISRWICC